MSNRNAALVVALLASTAAADTTSYDNSSLTFLFTPGYQSIAPDMAVTNATDLFVAASPVQNQLGTASGPSMDYDTSRIVFTSSQNAMERYSRSSANDVEFALAEVDTDNETGYGYFDGSGLDPIFYRELKTFSPGETIDASDFVPNSNFDTEGPIGGYSESSGFVPLVGSEAIFGFRVPAGTGYQYGFVRITLFEDATFPTTDAYEQATGRATQSFDAYLPTGWGFSDTVDEPALVSFPPACPADLDGNGSLNLDDIDAFVTAFLAGNLLADFDGTGTINIDDIDAYVAAFLAGC